LVEGGGAAWALWWAHMGNGGEGQTHALGAPPSGLLRAEVPHALLTAEVPHAAREWRLPLSADGQGWGWGPVRASAPRG